MHSVRPTRGGHRQSGHVVAGRRHPAVHDDAGQRGEGKRNVPVPSTTTSYSFSMSSMMARGSDGRKQLIGDGHPGKNLVVQGRLGLSPFGACFGRSYAGEENRDRRSVRGRKLSGEGLLQLAVATSGSALWAVTQGPLRRPQSNIEYILHPISMPGFHHNNRPPNRFCAAAPSQATCYVLRLAMYGAV